MNVGGANCKLEGGWGSGREAGEKVVGGHGTTAIVYEYDTVNHRNNHCVAQSIQHPHQIKEWANCNEVKQQLGNGFYLPHSSCSQRAAPPSWVRKMGSETWEEEVVVAHAHDQCTCPSVHSYQIREPGQRRRLTLTAASVFFFFFYQFA